ncbi:metallopeptidase [Candidatus Micrarchaeota archaeon]|nr:MAG: metallopeptidase [Candidatus Micrarchaeota archaeon]
MSSKFSFEYAPDVQVLVERLIRVLELDYIKKENVICMRSYGSTANAYARIWELPSIWQKALNIEPHYVIEVLSQHYDKLPQEEKEKTLIHELLHIPKSFSGATVPHKNFDRRIDARTVNRLYKRYKERLMDYG